MLKKNIFSIITAAVILYLSLSNPSNYEKTPFWNIPHADKIVHFGMYFFLMSVMVFENRDKIKTRNILYLTGIIPVLYGGSMEIFQELLTTTRSASIYDFLADFAGVLVSVMLCLTIKPVRKILFR